MVIALSTPLYAVAMAHRLRGLGKHLSYPTKHYQVCHNYKNKFEVNLPKAAMKKVINPLFTSKVQYALEIFGDPTSQICKDKEEDTIIKNCRSCTTWQ
jgi:hypothetical protein